MTKKHFIRVAEIIAERIRFQPNESDSLRAIAETFARDFAIMNPRFDRARFISACGF